MKDFIILIKTEEINMNKEKMQSEKRRTAKALILKNIGSRKCVFYLLPRPLAVEISNAVGWSL